MNPFRPLQVAIITGAPGSGKSTAVQALGKLEHPYLIFDMDNLLEPASTLTRTDIRTDTQRWPAYRKLWLEFLKQVAQNRRLPVLFGPLDKSDLSGLCDGLELHYLLLDCSDNIRQRRLQQREWTEAQITEALEDAKLLRSEIDLQFDTGSSSPEQIADNLDKWLKTLNPTFP